MKTILSTLVASVVTLAALGVTASADVVVRQTVHPRVYYYDEDRGAYVYRTPPYDTYYETRETNCLLWPILCATTTHRHPYVVEPY
jgi:hypothetical protein